MFKVVEVKDVVKEDKQKLNALVACAELVNDRDNLDKVEKVIAYADTIRDLVEEQKRIEKACKVCKEITEPAMWLCIDDNNEVVSTSGRKLFKFSKVGKVSKVVNPQALFAKLIADGITAEKILEGCTITPKAAAEMLGLSEKAFEENFVEFLEFSERKPTMKAV